MPTVGLRDIQQISDELQQRPGLHDIDADFVLGKWKAAEGVRATVPDAPTITVFDFRRDRFMIGFHHIVCGVADPPDPRIKNIRGETSRLEQLPAGDPLQMDIVGANYGVLRTIEQPEQFKQLMRRNRNFRHRRSP